MKATPLPNHPISLFSYESLQGINIYIGNSSALTILVKQMIYRFDYQRTPFVLWLLNDPFEALLQARHTVGSTWI
jgi:hypothetical protein